MLDYAIHIDCDFEDCETLSEKLIEFFTNSKSKKHWGAYYWQLEIGDETKKSHLQGWIQSDYTPRTIEGQKSNPFRIFIKPLITGTYSMAVIKETTYKSYIYNNETKDYVEHRWITIPQEELDVIPRFLEHAKFLDTLKNTEKVKKKNQTEETLDLLTLHCVSKNMAGESIINYETIESVMAKRLPRSMDQAIYNRNVLGCTFHLEQRHRNKHNKNITHLFSKSFNNEFGHLFKNNYE